jgi:hypothetical protein
MAHTLRAVAFGTAVLALVTTAALHAATSSSPVRPTASPTVVTSSAAPIRHPGAHDVPGGGTTCSYHGTVIACSDPSYGYWNSTDGCYWNLLVPQPPAGSPLWLGNAPSAGKLYHRTCFTDGGLGVGVLGNAIGFSSMPPPGYDGLAGDVGELLALKVILSLDILGPIISTAPSAGGSGLVGLPVWMWQTPTLLTWGPLSVGVSALSLGVGLTLLGAQVDWFMGDGHDVICQIGTPYSTHTGPRTSPDCGYVYTRPSTDQPGGHYTVTAAATWNITWQLGAETGAITIVRATTTPITIHELQVVNQ